MSRWNKNSNRFPQTVVPLDNLLREKENKNSVAIGTVMKWGDCKFTSIRSSCYNMGALSSTSPIQNSSEPTTDQGELNDTKITVEQVPKPRKFFKSRNSAPPAEIQQQMAMQQHHQQQSYQNQHDQNLSTSGGDEDEQTAQRSVKKSSKPKKEKVEKPPKPPKPEKVVKPKKEKKIKVKEVPQAQQDSEESEPESSSPTRRGRNYVEPTRSSGRARAKCVNYNEDAGEDEFYSRIERRVQPRHMATATITSPPGDEPPKVVQEEEQQIEVPVPQQSPVLHPPIVLRISKGTSRLVSTDNEDNAKSPSSSDENKNVSAPALATTDELIAVLSGESEAVETPQPEPVKPEKLKIRIKKDYIRSYNDSLKEQAEVVAPPPVAEPVPEPRTTRRRGKQQEPQRISPLVSEFDSQSSVLGSSEDGTSQASLAAAPPSGSENNSAMDTSPAEETPLVTQKRGRGRKKAAEVELKPPSEPPRKTRNTRNNPGSVASVSSTQESSQDTLPTRLEESSTSPSPTRATRNTRNTNVSPEKPTPSINPPAPRFFTRKRKVPAMEDIVPSFAPPDDPPPDQSNALNLSQKPTEVPEYKHKKLVKRSWEEPQPETLDNSGGVKLLISKKKGSIFKSRAMDKDEDNNKKRLNLYKHKWDKEGEEEGGKVEEKSEPSVETKAESVIPDFEDDAPVPRRYQVVRNVKKAHQIQEIGEFQEMDDDVEYLLDALQPNIQVATRCLSALQLASKCMTPSFRMHIRAHGIVPKFFKALADAPSDASLGLCTAMVMFALSQDTLKMDLDRGSLELMLNLLECESKSGDKQQKVRELCEEIQSQGKAIHLNLDNITAAQLAMESLLSLTSKRAGEWLKEDLRELGGIEHIIRTVCECCHQITEYVEEWTEPLLEKLNKIERCLRILENVTSNNEENQKYMLHYKAQVFVKTLCRFFNLLHNELTLYPTTEKTPKESAGVAIREALVPLLKVVINLTHPFNDRAIGSVFFGDQKEIFQTSIHMLLFGPSYVPTRHQFDLSVLTLVLLNNLAQSNEKNRLSIMQLSIPVEEFGKEKQPAIKSLVEYFYKCEDKARMIKKMTDEILDNPKERDAMQKSQDEVSALIQNSGSHMEHTILASVTSILIGFVVMENSNNEQIVRRYLRDGKFSGMVTVLVQYYEFLNLTVSSEASSLAQLKTIKNVIDYLRNCDTE